MSENCYFLVNEEKDVSSGLMVVCTTCRASHYPNTEAWFWQGSELGYGPWAYVCKICGKIIHRPPEEGDDEQTEAAN